MRQTLLIFFGVGMVVIAIAVATVLTSNKGSHLELKGDILKVRTGALGDAEQHRGAGFPRGESFRCAVRGQGCRGNSGEAKRRHGGWHQRVQERSSTHFSNTTGSWAISTTTGCRLKDTIPPHGTVDRMVAAHFEVSHQ